MASFAPSLKKKKKISRNVAALKSSIILFLKFNFLNVTENEKMQTKKPPRTIFSVV